MTDFDHDVPEAYFHAADSLLTCLKCGVPVQRATWMNGFVGYGWLHVDEAKALEMWRLRFSQQHRSMCCISGCWSTKDLEPVELSTGRWNYRTGTTFTLAQPMCRDHRSEREVTFAMIRNGSGSALDGAPAPGRDSPPDDATTLDTPEAPRTSWSGAPFTLTEFDQALTDLRRPRPDPALAHELDEITSFFARQLVIEDGPIHLVPPRDGEAVRLAFDATVRRRSPIVLDGSLSSAMQLRNLFTEEHIHRGEN